MCRVESRGAQLAMEIGRHACQAGQHAVSVRQQLKRGEAAEWDGQSLDPKQWCTPPAKARSYVYSSDTRPCQALAWKRRRMPLCCITMPRSRTRIKTAPKQRITAPRKKLGVWRAKRVSKPWCWDMSVCDTAIWNPCAKKLAGARGCHCGRGWHGHSNRRLKLASEVISLLGIILNKPLFTCPKPLPLPTAVLFFV